MSAITANARLFKGMVDLAQNKGYCFVSIERYDFDPEGADSDIEYNACETLAKKVRSFFLNFWRFQQMDKISKNILLFILFSIWQFY